MTEDYSDIINLPHPVSKNHPQMPMAARAAQFAPFAALTGYDSVIHETERLTDKQVELEDYDNNQLNRVFTRLVEHLNEHPQIVVSYFKPDERKDGGSYMTVSGRLKKIDELGHAMIMEEGISIPIPMVTSIEIKLENS